MKSLLARSDWPSLVFSMILWVRSSIGAVAAEPATPQWIANPHAQASAYVLTRQWTLEDRPKSAKLRIASDFAKVTIELDRKPILVLDSFCQTQMIDVSSWLHRGTNEFAVRLQRCDGPSAIAFECEANFDSGKRATLISDSEWRVENLAPGRSRSSHVATMGRVRPELWGVGQRDISLAPTENYEQWRQALGKDKDVVAPKFWTPSAFQITRLHTASLEEGSWISLTFDPEGRAIVSREDQGLLRMTMDAKRESVTSVETVESELKECRGLIFDGTRLLANANNSKGLYQVRWDTDGKPRLDLLREFPGSVGHGRNDVTIDQGWLYLIHGDSVDLPKESIVDWTSPSRHWSGDVSHKEGHLLRMRLETQEWELLCGGMRNPYGIAIHQGTPFTLDADNEFDMGTPWYRPTRLVSPLRGGDVGYRTANQKLPPRFHDQPENVPPVLTIGKSSPTAVFSDPSLDFPDPYRNALYLLDWTYGRLLAIHLVQRGASWRAQAELFLQGRPLNVTDVARGPDGAMYLITGGRKTQSSLYRIGVAPDFPRTPRQREEDEGSHERANEEWSRLQERLRSDLEGEAARRDPGGLPRIWSHIAHSDPVIRHAARIALERLPIDAWRSTVLREPDHQRWLYGALSLVRQNDPADAPMLFERTLTFPLAPFELKEKIVWTRLCEWILRIDRDRMLKNREALVARFLEIWPDSNVLQVAPEGTSVELRQRLALLAGEIEATSMLDRIVQDLIGSTLQEDRIAGLLAVRHLRQGWSTPLRQAQFTALRDASKMLGGQGLPSFMEGIRQDSLATLSDSERAAVHHLLSPDTSETEVDYPPRPFVTKWSLENTQALVAETIIQGDREKGKDVFRMALCARCHRKGEIGFSLGPDLSFVGRRFSPRDLLDSILSPSRSVAENYRLDTIVTESGAIHTGQILIEGDFRSEKLKMLTNPLKPRDILEIDKREIVEHRQSATSPMPEGLLDTFTLEEIRNLLAYLQSAQ